MTKSLNNGKPININRDVWYYETSAGLEFVVYGRKGDKPRLFTVSKRKIKAFLKRADA